MKRIKKLAVLGVMMVFGGCVCACSSNDKKGGSGTTSTQSVNTVTNLEYLKCSEEQVKVDNGNDVFINLNGERLLSSGDESYCKINVDGSKLFSLTENGDKNELYYIDAHLERTFIAELNSSRYEDDFWISYMGDSVVYVCNDDDGNEKLCLYEIATKQTRIIEKHKFINYVKVAFSSNGKYVLYNKFDNGKVKIYLYNVSGEVAEIETKISDNREVGPEVFGVSNDGKYVYYFYGSNNGIYSMYVYHDGVSTLIDNNIRYEENIIGVEPGIQLNLDGTELLYCKDGVTYYYSVVDNRKVKLFDSNYETVVVPDITAKSTNANHDTTVNYDVYLGVNTFKGITLLTEDAFYSINSNGTGAVKLADSKNCELYEISLDGNKLMYVSDGTLYKIDDISKKTKAYSVSREKTISNFVASKDFEEMYYVANNSLIYWDGKTETIISENIMSSESVAYSDYDYQVYYLENEKIYSYNAKTNEKRIAYDKQAVSYILEYMGMVGFVTKGTEIGHILKAGKVVELY